MKEMIVTMVAGYVLLAAVVGLIWLAVNSLMDKYFARKEMLTNGFARFILEKVIPESGKTLTKTMTDVSQNAIGFATEWQKTMMSDLLKEEEP